MKSTIESPMKQTSHDWWDENPCEAWHSSYEPGSMAWDEEVREWRYRVQPHIPHFADQFIGWKGKQVLDVGCGIGTDALSFARAGATVLGIDFSAHSINLANSRVSPHLQDHIRFWIANAEDPEWEPLPPGPFDLVWMFGSLHHMEHPETALQVVRERLAPNGILKLMVYAKWSLKFLLHARPEAAPGCPIVRTYTAKTIRRLLETMGFFVVRIEKTHIFPYQIKAYREHRLVYRWPYSWMTERELQRLGSFLGHHLLVTACR